MKYQITAVIEFTAQVTECSFAVTQRAMVLKPETTVDEIYRWAKWHSRDGYISLKLVPTGEPPKE